MGKLSKLELLRSTSRERARSFITNQVALNVFCPTGKGGGSDPTCSPKGKSQKPTDTKAFKDWFGKSKVVDKAGKPLVIYHGTNKSFGQFQTDLPEGDTWGMLDRGLGAHFAEDSNVTSTFSIGEYAQARDSVVSSEPGNSWFRDKTGKLDYSGIPVLVTEPRGKRGKTVAYDAKEHGGTWGIADRHGADSRLTVLPSGGQTIPVYLSVKKPLKVDPIGNESDQSAVHRVVASKAFEQSQSLFVKAFEATGRSNGKEVWEAIKSGKGYDAGTHENYKTFEDVARNFTGMLNDADHIKQAKQILQKQGYDGIQYRNTSRNEVKEGENATAWIVFSPSQIKSAIGNRGTFDPNDPLIANAAKKKLVNPLLVDPTRTTTLQRAFEEQLSKRFAKFQKALIAYMTSGGLTTNAFCPTGEGGGIDPTCSPKSTQVQIVRPKSKNESFEDEIIFKLPQGRMGVAKSKWAPTDWSVTDTFVEEDSRRQGVASKLIETAKANLQGTIGAQCSSDKSVNLFWKHGFRLESGSIEDAYNQRKEYSSVNLIYTPGFTTNAFCPTGSGGGVDPSCSPKGKSKKTPKSLGGFSTPQLEQLSKDAKDYGMSVEEYAKYFDVKPAKISVKEAPVELPTSPKSAKGYKASQEIDYDVIEESDYVGPVTHLPIGSISKTELWDKPVKGQTQKSFEQTLKNSREKVEALKEEMKAGNPLPAILIEQVNGGLRVKDGHHRLVAAEELNHQTIPTRLWQAIVGNAFKFETSAAKVENFEQWIISKLTETMEDKDIYSGKDWWKTYVERAYKQGADRAFDTMKNKGKQDQRSSDRMAGAKNQFFSTFGSDAAKERMKLIAGRTYKGMKGLTDMMKSQLTLALIDGLLQGQSPRVIAKALVDKVQINKARAMTIARTEIVRSHNEGTLATLKALGVSKVGVQVEIAVSGKACPICQKYKGKILTIEEAEGLFPLHPNCRCTPIPHVSDEPSPQKERQRKNIESSVKSATRKSPTRNVFCPTGKGGGIDATCSPATLSSVSRLGPMNKVVNVKRLLSDKGLGEKKLLGMINEKMGWKETDSKAAYTRLAHIAGAPTGAEVKIDPYVDEDGLGFIHVTYHTDKIEYAQRSINFEDGKRVLTNQQLKVRKEFQGQGEGTKIFAQQVDQAFKNGITKIETEAGRQSGMNGYYTWALLGYDAPLRGMAKANLEKTKKMFPDAKKISDLMQTPEGREWWKKIGFTFNGTFTTDPKTTPRKVLDSYVAAKFQKES